MQLIFLGNRAPACSQALAALPMGSTHSFSLLGWGQSLPPGKLSPVTAWGMFATITVCVCVLIPVSGLCISIMRVSICKTGWGGFQERAGGSPASQHCWCATAMHAALSEPSPGTRDATSSPWQLTLPLDTHTEPGLAQEGQHGTTP